MRLWEISLIHYLPREQLVAQWRECSAIAGAIQKNGTPNQILVNFVLNYDYDHFISYCTYLRQEMTNRGYRTMNNVWNKIIALKPNYNLLPLSQVYADKFGSIYKKICYYNLLEKFMCGGISLKEWEMIEIWAAQLGE